ncbi:glycoprotein-N-acetylgalactosamine 3-beta-galactosyltransferase 1 [Ceratitis capitata]|uniref:glycoprotein-N-acetylgalactosamine 3-beta-galactosyltransferase 1 n=1 Tax=Ceratitis capitata TaxID=7213 RepID=UPI000A108EC2|nr:glycoprotein-N-acetylgalactosamine 3-beta-galactosyltransferase 1 [Ceratitis capitata]
MDEECANVASVSKLRACLFDLLESLKILVKFVVISLLCFNLLQTDYTCLLNLAGDSANDSLPIARSNISRPRVFCLIFTYKELHEYSDIHSQATWLQHCDRYLFVSNHPHSVLEPLVVKNRYRWGSMLISFDYVSRYYGNDFDWLLKVNSDNFVILENLRKLLEPHSPEEPISFGCKMKNKENEIYTHGGTVLSREALRRLVTVAFKNSSICYLSDSPYDDEELGRCLRGVDVEFGDTRDAMGRQRFIPFTPQEYLTELKPENNEWFLNRSYYEINNTTRQLSPEAISFYNVSPETIVTLYYYIYKLRIFGKNTPSQNVTEKKIKFN